MARIPKKVINRISSKLKLYQDIVANIRSRDVSEADTVTVIKDIMSDVFGYDKYLELTSEQQIRGTYCDLAVRLDGKIHYLIEIKAAAVELNEGHLRQAINYGANQGIEWVILTNAFNWRVFRIKFGQPIAYEEVLRFCLTDLVPKSEEDLNRLFMLCRESLSVDALREFHHQAQLINRYTIAQILKSENVVSLVRREMKRMFPALKPDAQLVKKIIVDEVLKREVVQGEQVVEAEKKIRQALNKLSRKANRKKDGMAEPMPEISSDASSLS
jgi:predicted type IV restriction endonuclease